MHYGALVRGMACSTLGHAGVPMPGSRQYSAEVYSRLWLFDARRLGPFKEFIILLGTLAAGKLVQPGVKVQLQASGCITRWCSRVSCKMPDMGHRQEADACWIDHQPSWFDLSRSGRPGH